jgi:2-methylcitrate dehydratase
LYLKTVPPFEGDNMLTENIRPCFDSEITAIAEYVVHQGIESHEAYSTARYCLLDALGCAILALKYPECVKLLGPIIPGTKIPQGVSIPGTTHVLDPIQAAFNIGTLIRWLDFNDTWLAAEWGHPSDTLGAILAVADYQSQVKSLLHQAPYSMRDVFTAMIKAYEIQGILALENSFNRLGIDHVILVKLASTALASHLFGLTKEEILKAISQAWIDGHSLRTYRHAPNTGSRKSWAAGDATSRGVWLAWLTQRGEMGYPSALTAPTWGFQDTINRGQTLIRSHPYHAYVMENILFKVAFPAEFHAQTAVECAIKLHPFVHNRLDDIAKIELYTQESAMRIINKTGPLYNPADRDHCIQYMVAVALLHGDLKAEYYEDNFAHDPRIDELRNKMIVRENTLFSQNYMDPLIRSIGNSLQIFYKNGACTEKMVVEFPIGHKKRRNEAIPLLIKKFKNNVSWCLGGEKTDQVIELFMAQDSLEKMGVHEFMELWKPALSLHRQE